MPHAFNTITGDDWRRSISDSRTDPNLVIQKIMAAKTKFAQSLPGLITQLKKAESNHDLAQSSIADVSRAFGERFREERRTRELSPKKMAAKLGIKKSMLLAMESGTRLWSVERAALAISILAKT